MRRISGIRTNDWMVDNLKASGLLRSEEVEAVMRKVDRGHYASFNPYFDSPQSIGYNATISAPHMHALALDLLMPSIRQVNRRRRALDVGSGSGYLTTCLALLLGPEGRAVGVEHIPELVRLSETNVRRDHPSLLKSGRVRFLLADGRYGYPPEAPYDVIHVGAAADELPKELEKQLAPGGRMVVPVGELGSQRLNVVIREKDGTIRHFSKMLVAFVPLTDAPTQWSGTPSAPRASTVEEDAHGGGSGSRSSSMTQSRRAFKMFRKPKSSAKQSRT